MADWPFPNKAVVSVKGQFSRAGGFQAVMDNLVTTPRERSIILFMDSDMVTYPGFVNNVFKQTVRGKVRCAVNACTCTAWCQCLLDGVVIMHALQCCALAGSLVCSTSV